MFIDEVYLWITCKKIGLALLLKTTSFRLFHIAQTKVQTPTPLVFYLSHLTNSKKDY
jgi:hypothetical protein